MSLFDSASLVVTPNGYKEDKLYAIKPTDGSGDLVVTRATTATRVNSDGLIEQVPYNLLQRSEQFENAAWLAGGSGVFVVTANSTTAPNGTLTADKLIAPLTNQTIRQNVANINTTYTLSIYLKTNSGTKQMRLYINDTQIESTVNVTSDWQRFTLSGTTGGTLFGSGRVGIANVDILDNSSFVYAWGAQLVTGTSAKEYFPTTDRLDVPRLDYTNSSCPSILVEPQRTNLYLRNEEFDNASWVKSNATVTSNATNSPIGNLTSDKLIASATTSTHFIVQQPAGAVSGVTATISIFAKASELSRIQLLNNGGGLGTANFNLSAGTATLLNGVSASIENYGNGWYRCIMSYIPTITGSYNIQIRLSDNSGNTTFLGNGTDGLFIWGSQLEAGSNATSYIPTVASSVTRNADVISKTGISSLIGQTEGTLFVDVNLSVNANERRLLTISNGTEAQRLFVWTLGNLLYTSFNNISVNLGNFPIGTTKIAIGYTISGGNTTYSIKVNNNALVTGTAAAAAPNPLSAINLGSNATSGLQLNDRINSTLIWKERLSNTELAQLTTI